MPSMHSEGALQTWVASQALLSKTMAGQWERLPSPGQVSVPRHRVNIPAGPIGQLSPALASVHVWKHPLWPQINP